MPFDPHRLGIVISPKDRIDITLSEIKCANWTGIKVWELPSGYQLNAEEIKRVNRVKFFIYISLGACFLIGVFINIYFWHFIVKWGEL